jgi:hypothetical protein
VAGLLDKTTTQVGPVRDKLVKKALCYMPRWGELDYTVPMFDEFMKRGSPWPSTSASRAVTIRGTFTDGEDPEASTD